MTTIRVRTRSTHPFAIVHVGITRAEAKEIEAEYARHGVERHIRPCEPSIVGYAASERTAGPRIHKLGAYKHRLATVAGGYATVEV